MTKQSTFTKRNPAWMILVATTAFLMFPENAYMQTQTSYLLPDGTKYVSWEVRLFAARTLPTPVFAASPD